MIWTSQDCDLERSYSWKRRNHYVDLVNLQNIGITIVYDITCIRNTSTLELECDRLVVNLVNFILTIWAGHIHHCNWYGVHSPPNRANVICYVSPNSYYYSGSIRKLVNNLQLLWSTCLRGASHARLRARDHYTPSTLIGGKVGAGPSSLHTKPEAPTEYVNARWM